MKQVLVKSEFREGVGKGAARKARAKGLVPAVIYGKGRAATLVSVGSREFGRALQNGLAPGRLVDLVVSGDGREGLEKTAILKEVQRDSITGEIIHADFQEVSMDEAITASVRVVLTGEDKRVRDGGVVEHLLWQIQVHGLPTAIPDRIEVPVSGLRIGDSVKVSDLRLPEGVKALGHGDETVVTVAAPTRAAEEPRPEAAAATAAGAPEPAAAAEAKKEE